MNELTFQSTGSDKITNTIVNSPVTIKKLSIVVPVYNESRAVYDAYHTIGLCMEKNIPSVDFEIIFVDDGSIDDSFDHLTSLVSQDSRVRVIRLAGNHGAHMAIRAGLENARGQCACFLACDLQDPPEIIPRMLDVLVPSIEIIWAVRNNRDDNFSSRLFGGIFYWLARLLVSRNLPPTGASMFLLGPKALKSVSLYKERNLTLEGLFLTMGFRQAYIQYDRLTRNSGHSKWTIGKRLKLFADFFVGYSYIPVRLMSYSGIVVAIGGFLYALFIIINRIFFSTPIQGWSSLMMVLLTIGGLQMIMLGVIGEYLWRTLDEARARPRYMIDTILENVS